MKDMKSQIIELANKGMGKTAIHGFIQVTYGVSNKEAYEAIDETGVKFKGSSENENRSLCVTLMRTNQSMARKELVALIVEKCGYTPATANHYVSAMPLCVEWAKQEASE